MNTNPRFRETSSTRIHHRPRTNSDSLDRSAVNTYEMALCIGGMGFCASEKMAGQVETLSPEQYKAQ